jgi:hypothetical protein
LRPSTEGLQHQQVEGALENVGSAVPAEHLLRRLG